jgi:hypothetical protein
MAANLADAVAHLVRIRDATGRHISLALEPEPDCLIESTPEAVSFFADRIDAEGARRLASVLGMSRPSAVRMLRSHLGVCVDTCHMALCREDLSDSLSRLEKAGIRVPKVQLSAALAADGRAVAGGCLRGFCDPVYLHQVSIRDVSGACRRMADLEPALDGAVSPDPGEEWRVHFHIPLYVETAGPVSSTSSELTDGFFRQLATVRVPHLEIETYTFDVLPPDMRAAGVVESVCREYRWVLNALRKASEDAYA